MTEKEVLREAARAFRKADRIKQDQAELDNRIRLLCRQWGEAEDAPKQYGVSPTHLRRACAMRGLLYE